jgi:hypothetical protein
VRIRLGRPALIILVLAGVVACTSDKASRSGSPSPSSAATHHQATPTTLATAGNADPKQQRAQFEQLLGQHSLLAVRLTRSLASAPPEFRQAADASLRQNTDALSQLVSSAYSNPDGDRFKQLLEGYVTNLTAYANAATSKDASKQAAARAAIMAYCDDYGDWFAQASNGRVEAGDAVRTARTRVEELMRQVDAYAARDYEQAYRIGREAYQHTFASGATLAKASVPPETAIAMDAAPDKLRSAFAMLLGEHMELIIDAQRATFAGSPEFKAAATQVNANTTTLTQAMGAIVGPKKAAEFQTAWANHVEGLMAYTAAVAGNDEAGKSVAKQNLDGFAARLALYLSDIVRNVLAADPLTEAITAHDAHLINHVDAYAAKDYGKAQQLQLAGYQQMLGVANTLVDAIQRTVQPRLPTGGPKTGGGGTARPPR